MKPKKSLGQNRMQSIRSEQSEESQMNKKILPKKRLGQNFLRDNKVLEKIITSANLKSDDFVLEVGPGEGVLTEKLIQKARKVLAIELDGALANKLKKRYKENKKIEIISADILKINLPETLCHSERTLSERSESKGKSKNLLNNITSDNSKKILRLRPSTDSAQDDTIKYKVVANIPYYITSPIIQLFLETQLPPSEMILMVQREVAERICASKGQMSILAVSVQYYAQTELLFHVDRKSFFPAPEVDSAVIKISKINPPAGGQGTMNNKEEIRHFFRVVKAGFSAKRKTLVNNLSASLKLDKKEVKEKLEKIGITPNQRAQELSVEDWKKLVNSLVVIASETKQSQN